MTRYLVIHTPRTEDDGRIHPPTRLPELARDHGKEGASPRWITTFSPDLHDDRMVSMWEAKNASDIQQVIFDYGFLDNYEAHAIAVREWGPDEVLAAENEA
ncbi:MAG: hypothetical protein QM589_12075 [Thermomicrobiales bacterium]